MPDSTTNYVIRADDTMLAGRLYYLYYMSEPFYEDSLMCPEDEFEPAEDDIAYQWATHPTGAHQYAGEAETREVIRGLPAHANPKAIPYHQALAEHTGGAPSGYPFNVKSMLTDEEKNQPPETQMPETKEPPKKQVPFVDSIV